LHSKTHCQKSRFKFYELFSVGALPGPDLAGRRPGPRGVFGISERDWLSNYRVLKIEGFGGRLPVGGRPGAHLPPTP